MTEQQERTAQLAQEYIVPQEQADRDQATQVVRKGSRTRVVIVGSGFAGLNAARELANHNLDVVILNRNNYHGFWPLLYQVATAGIEPESIAYPVRGIIRNFANTDFLMAEVTGVDFDKKLVLTDGAPVEYDYLLLAAGSANNYFGNDALADQTFGMKDINEASHLRNHVLTVFEKAVREPDTERRQALMTFVIIGGGPTGVELAGAFAELIRHVLRKDYPMLNIHDARVILVEASKTILASFPERLQRNALKQLKRMGVEIHLGQPATVENNVVRFASGEQISAETVVWAAGVRSAELTDQLGLAQGRGARVKVTPTLNLPERPEVFVAGDMAYLEGPKAGVAYPMVAQVAIQQGKRVGKNILAMIEGKPLRNFVYHDLGQMATIGRRSAEFDAFGIRLSGLIAWLGWLFIHLMYLVGFRNRLVVLSNWAYNYFTYGGGVRLITRPGPQKEPEE